jgi:hypothetical protein
VPELTWNAIGEHLFETGVDRGVLYIDEVGYAWNGLVSVDTSPSGGETRSHYMDGVKYLNLSGKEEYEATINALYSPPEFDECDGLGTLRPGLFAGQQKRKSFGFAYRSNVGNDLNGVDHGYKIHIVYNALAKPSQKSYSTIGDSPEATLLSWSITTKPIIVSGMVNSSYLVIDSTRSNAAAVQELETILYGSELAEPRLPEPEEIVSIFTDSSSFVVTDIGGGEFTISGSDLAVFEVSADLFQITHDGVVPIDEDLAQITSP